MFKILCVIGFVFAFYCVAGVCGQDPQPCCLSSSFETFVRTWDPEKHSNVLTHWHFDSEKQRELTKIDIKGTMLTVLKRFDFNAQYVISDNKCEHSELRNETMKPICIPKLAKFTGKQLLGGVLPCNVFEVEGIDQTFEWIVSEDDCTTIFAWIHDKTEGPNSVGIEYFDFSAGIVDETVFDVPAICK